VRERVGVPLDLLVSLLENTRREVRLSVPVTGVLSSRQFDFGDAVWEAIARPPSRPRPAGELVGKMFYTKEARIDTISIWPVSFRARHHDDAPRVDKHAERLGTFLGRRGDRLRDEARPDGRDVDALKLQALKKQIDALVHDLGTAELPAAGCSRSVPEPHGATDPLR
jgi:hypothetical protein